MNMDCATTGFGVMCLKRVATITFIVLTAEKRVKVVGFGAIILSSLWAVHLNWFDTPMR